MTATDNHGQPVTGCASCDNGCMCEAGSCGCEHFGCWGRETETTCPSAEPHREWLQERRAARLRSAS